MIEIKSFTLAPDRIVSVTEHHDRIFVATERQVFELVDEKLVPLKFEIEVTDTHRPEGS